MPLSNHVILTRFNLPTPGVESLVRAREGWLRERVGLFERYCAPSVAAQTQQDLTWLVYFDPDSPSWLVRRLQPMVDRGLFHPVYRISVNTEELLLDIRAFLPEQADLLITTNLDNDDALACDFVERLRAIETRFQRTAVYFRHGLIKGPQGVYRRTDRRNAFVSVWETWDSPVTAWSEYHNEYHRVMPTIEIGGPPAWLQVIHGTNVSNRVRGRLVAPGPYKNIFEGLIDDLPVHTRWVVGADTIVGQPIRVLRDGCRSIGRKIGLSLLGKSRYSRAKQMVVALRGRK